MNIISNVFSNSFSFVLLLILLIYTVKYSNTDLTHNRIFIWIIAATMLMLSCDSISRLDGHPDTILYYFNHIGNFLLFSLNPTVSSLWILYVFSYKKKSSESLRWIVGVITAIAVANFTMVVLSLDNGWFYYIDEQNIYHRGPYFLVSIVFTFILLLFASFVVYRRRNRIERKHYYALLLFSVPPFICIVLQILFYGYSFIYNGIALSAFVVFLYVQNQDIFTDYLTGVSNRKKLELHLARMVGSSTPQKTFSAIMIDLDSFKKINDTYGHKAGDEVIKIAADLLSNCVGKNDLIARYGGDEFCIVLSTSDTNVMNETVERIKAEIQAFNAKGLLPYKLGLSMGYAIYEYGTNVDDFINMIDKFMYDEKHHMFRL